MADPAALQREGLFVVEGRLTVQRLLEDERFKIHSVVVTPAAAMAMAVTLQLRPAVPVVVCDPATLEQTTGFHFHRGCLALAYRHPLDLAIEELALAPRILAIEGVGNPDNIGGLFRAAFALGVDVVVLDRTAGDPLYRKAIRTSMGATLRLPFTSVDDLPAVVRHLGARGFQTIALTPHESAVPLDEVQAGPMTRLVVMVGSEAQGLTPAALDAASVKLRIPVDARADSLNVVVAASIALHALRPRS